MECHIAGGGKKPDFACVMERYRLDIVGLTSTHSMGSNTKIRVISLLLWRSHKWTAWGRCGDILQSKGLEVGKVVCSMRILSLRKKDLTVGGADASNSLGVQPNSLEYLTKWQFGIQSNDSLDIQSNDSLEYSGYLFLTLASMPMLRFTGLLKEEIRKNGTEILPCDVNIY